MRHRYYRTEDIEDAVEWATDTMEKKKSYVLWNHQYENLNSIALAFGLNPGSIYARIKENDSLEDIVSGLLQKETITFRGKEYKGISALATTYNHHRTKAIEFLFVTWFMEQNDIKYAEDAMKIYRFVEKHIERILQTIGC